MCAVVIVDYGGNFKGIFKEMCEHLNLTYWCISRGSYKGNSAKKYHCFLNKNQTITDTDRGSHDKFIQNAKTSEYAWNSAPIYDNDIPCSLAAIGREFRFPLDVEISATPTINPTTNIGLYNYLRGVSNYTLFTQEVLNIIIRERHTLHHERHNFNIIPTQDFRVGNIFKDHFQVQSNSDSGTVKKLGYQVCGPFKIIEDLGHNSFHS